MDTTVRELRPAELELRKREMLGVYAQAFAAPPYEKTALHATQFGLALDRHRAYPGFGLLAALSGGQDGQLVGFAYGHHCQPGQWWHDHVRPALGDEMAAGWLEDAFVLVELVLLPTFQGRRIGSRLHDSLFAGRPERTAVLSTIAAETRARTLYRRRGYQVLVAEMLFSKRGPAYSVLGRHLKQDEQPR